MLYSTEQVQWQEARLLIKGPHAEERAHIDGHMLHRSFLLFTVVVLTVAVAVHEEAARNGGKALFKPKIPGLLMHPVEPSP